MDIPPQFKLLTAYIKRAEELEKDSSNINNVIIAYYCRLYAIDKGMKLNLPQNELTFLLSIMDIIEKTLKSYPNIKTFNGKQIIEDYALNIFNNADNEDC